MNRPPVFFPPEAMEEAEAAVEWYSEQNLDTAVRFVQELTHALKTVAESPSRWPRFEGGTRRLLLRRFPFLLVYRASADAIEVVAVAHGRRRPGYCGIAFPGDVDQDRRGLGHRPVR